jgi:hypothetical protein
MDCTLAATEGMNYEQQIKYFSDRAFVYEKKACAIHKLPKTKRLSIWGNRNKRFTKYKMEADRCNGLVRAIFFYTQEFLKSRNGIKV